MIEDGLNFNIITFGFRRIKEIKKRTFYIKIFNYTLRWEWWGHED